MFKFFKRDPLTRAKKHVDKAMEELEDGYPDYASIEYEKAAQFFLEAGHVDFAIKYYREASYCALEEDDHSRAAQMKMNAAELMLSDGLFSEGGSLYSEASDHFNREKKMRESIEALAIAVISFLAARSFDTAINLFKKAEKRSASNPRARPRVYELAALSVKVLCEGEDVSPTRLEKVLNGVKYSETINSVINFVVSSVRLAMQTEVVVEWAGKERDSVPAKMPIEFEVRYKCPVPVRVIDYKLPLSNSLTFVKEPEISSEISTTGSWLIVLNPVLSGEGVVGPFKMTLEGEQVLVHKHSNRLEFRIEPAPAKLNIDISPRRIDCNLGDEVVFDVEIKNSGAGPANNIIVKIEMSDNLEISVGNVEKSIQFIGVGENLRFQVYVRGVSLGDGILTVHVSGSNLKEELTEAAVVRVV